MSNDKISTIKYRDREGWNAKSQLNLADNRVLQISTYKASNGSLRTSASVHLKVDGGLRHDFGYGTPGGDFSETLVVTKPARVTEKVISAQHESVLKTIPGILSAVQAHYAKFPVSPALA